MLYVYTTILLCMQHVRGLQAVCCTINLTGLDLKFAGWVCSYHGWYCVHIHCSNNVIRFLSLCLLPFL